MNLSDHKADIREIFKASEEIFAAKLRAIRASIHHAGLKGAGVEMLVQEFFEAILPKNIGIGTGLVIDQYGAMSKQVDIVLYDSAATPSFLSYGGVRLFPVECVYFVIEVKTNLSGAEFDKSVENMRSVKNLSQGAYTFSRGRIWETKELFGSETRHWLPIYLIFALGSSEFTAVEERFRKHRESGLPVEKQIDCIYVLGCGTIANILADQSVSLLPAQGSFLIIPDSPDVVIFLSLFSVYFSQVDMGANFNFLQYIGGDLPRSRVLISKEQIPAAYPGAPIIDEGDR